MKTKIWYLQPLVSVCQKKVSEYAISSTSWRSSQKFLLLAFTLKTDQALMCMVACLKDLISSLFGGLMNH
jgi:hypothetical protein